MTPVSRVLILAGVLLVLAGLVWPLAARFLHLGRLPGDIVIERENFRFRFPLATCLAVSLALTLLLAIFRRLGR